MAFISQITGSLPKFSDYLVYGAIALVTLIGILKCWVPLWSMAHQLKRAVRVIRRTRTGSSDNQVWNDEFFLGSRLSGAWARFLHNASRLDSNSIPCNVSDYINDDTVTHGPGNAQLAELIPGLLTSLGILGTFLGMMRGLGAIDFSDSANIIAGIPTLLSSMQFAFGTSVAGVSCSIVFNIVNRIAQGATYRATDNFTNVFTKDVIHYDQTDNDVVMIIQNAQRDQILQQMADNLPNQVASAVHYSVSQAMQPVASSMDNFLIGATRSQIDGVSRIVNNFIGQMNQSLNGQFLEFGKTLSALNRQQSVEMDALSGSLDTARQLIDETRSIQGISKDVMANFQSFISELTIARTRDEKFESGANDVLSSMRKASEQQQRAFTALQDSQRQLTDSMERFAAKVQQSTQKMAQDVEDSTGNFKGSSKEIRQASVELAKEYQKFTELASGEFTATMEKFMESMNKLLEHLDTMTSASANNSGDLSEIQRLLANIQQSLENSVSSEDK